MKTYKIIDDNTFDSDRKLTELFSIEGDRYNIEQGIVTVVVVENGHDIKVATFEIEGKMIIEESKVTRKGLRKLFK